MKLKMLRMNKKGEEESSSTGTIIAMVIAVAVLIIVIIGIWMYFSGKAIPFFEYLPGFNQTKPGVTDLELLRYIIAEDKVQYYDGTTWIDFKQGETIELNGKKIIGSTVRGDLASQFIFKTTTINGVSATIIPPNVGYSIDFWQSLGQVASAGLYAPNPSQTITVKGGSIKLAAQGYDFWIKMGEDNKIYYMKEGELQEFEGGNVPSAMRKKIVAWRNGLINNSVDIKYVDADGRNKSIKTCYIKPYYYEWQKWALVVDLSRPLKEGGNCPYSS